MCTSYLDTLIVSQVCKKKYKMIKKLCIIKNNEKYSFIFIITKIVEKRDSINYEQEK